MEIPSFSHCRYLWAHFQENMDGGGVTAVQSTTDENMRGAMCTVAYDVIGEIR